ncbi:MAG TPA: hypothetical protein VGB04_02110 [Allosphingosinicella sp.]|jgi:hypothetical protein
MALIFDLNVEERFSLSEYVAFVIDNVDVRDFDSLAESGRALRALANDREFLLDRYHEELKALYDTSSQNTLTPQSVVLVQQEKFFVRSNIWLPANPDPTQFENEKKLYAYDLPHDHNFDFITVGYAGVGYVTDLYSYDIDSVVGYVGEPVALENLGRVRLEPGRVMAYRCNRDVHTQYEPEQISVTINLIPSHERLVTSPQYVFDPERGVIDGGVSDQVGSRLFLLDFFRHMHDENSIELLETVSRRHPCPRTSGQALSVLEQLAPAEGDRFRARVERTTLAYSRSDMIHAGHARQRASA